MRPRFCSIGSVLVRVALDGGYPNNKELRDTMKNVLFATTALVAFGGAAIAQELPEGLSVSGDAELGITYVDIDGADLANDGFDLVGDYTAEFTFNAISNSGISFGANGEIELPSNDIDDFNAFVSGNFGTLTLGDIDSAYDASTVGIETGGLADEADFYFSDAGIDGLVDPQFILRYDYTISGITISASIEQGNDATIDNILAAGLDYSGSVGGLDVSAGVGVQATETEAASGFGDGDHTLIHVSGRVGFGSFGVNAFFESWDGPSDVELDHETIAGSVDFTSGPITVGANVVIRTSDIENESFGAFASYDLGGGLALVGAVGFSNTGDAATATQSNFISDGDDIVTAGIGFDMSF